MTFWPFVRFYIISNLSFFLKKLIFFFFFENLKQTLFSGLLSCKILVSSSFTFFFNSSHFFFFFFFFNSSHFFFHQIIVPAERDVLMKERASGSYHLSAYFLAKSISEAPIILILPTAFLIISYWVAAMNPSFVAFLGFTFAELMCVLV